MLALKREEGFIRVLYMLREKRQQSVLIERQEKHAHMRIRSQKMRLRNGRPAYHRLGLFSNASITTSVAIVQSCLDKKLDKTQSHSTLEYDEVVPDHDVDSSRPADCQRRRLGGRPPIAAASSNRPSQPGAHAARSVVDRTCCASKKEKRQCIF